MRPSTCRSEMTPRTEPSSRCGGRVPSRGNIGNAHGRVRHGNSVKPWCDVISHYEESPDDTHTHKPLCGLECRTSSVSNETGPYPRDCVLPRFLFGAIFTAVLFIWWKCIGRRGVGSRGTVLFSGPCEASILELACLGVDWALHHFFYLCSYRQASTLSSVL